MITGDLCKVVHCGGAWGNEQKVVGYGIFLEIRRSGCSHREPPEVVMLWKGRVTCFDPCYWIFEVL